MFAALALATARPAQAKTPCWKQVISDWTADERIDNVYPLHCYPDAIAHVPEDLRVYSSIVDDINNARLQVVRQVVRRGGQKVRVTTGHRTKTNANQKSGQPNQALFKEAFNRIGPRNADSVPLPLLILGGLALLMIAAGATGLVSRRLRTKRAGA